MKSVRVFIEEYPVSKFMQMTGKQQNDTLEKAYPGRNRKSLKQSKSLFFLSMNKQIHQVDRPKNKSFSPADKNSSPPDDAALPAEGLTEKMIEQAIVRALYTDPTIQTINAGITWLDKKKKISIEDNETGNEKAKEYYNTVLKQIYE